MKTVIILAGVALAAYVGYRYLVAAVAPAPTVTNAIFTGKPYRVMQ